MRILAIGDIFGRTGRRVIEELLRRIRKDYKIDLVIANVENATHGKSISHSHYLTLSAAGIDIMTSGNHIFALEETKLYISSYQNLLRPLNSNPFHPGNGTYLFKFQERRIRVTNLIGNSFMQNSENPYFSFEKVLSTEESADIHIVDFHAEATAEKLAFAWYFDGKLSALYGTHTHVQTADERTLPKGTAFITDIGMTGPRSGIIGARPQAIVQRSKYGFAAKMEPAEDSGQFNGVIFEFSSDNKVRSIKRLNFAREDYERELRFFIVSGKSQ